MSKRSKTKIIFALTSILPLLTSPCAHAQNETDLMRAVNSERNDLRECWNMVAALYASKTCESPSVVINATFGKCMPLETKLRDAIVRQAPHMHAGFSTWIDGYRAGARELLLPVILDKRIELGNCAKPSN